MLDLCKKYIENVRRYNDLENVVFSDGDSDEIILETLSLNTSRKRILRKEQDSIVKELLFPYESKEKEIDENVYQELQVFAKHLFDHLKEVDNAMSLRIHKLLLEYAKQQDDINKIVEEIYWCGICQWKIYKYDVSYFDNPYFDMIVQYEKDFDSLSSEIKPYFLRCVANRILNYTNQRPNDLLRVGQELVAWFTTFEKEHLDVNFNYNAAILSTYRNMTTCLRGFRNNEDVTKENIECALNAVKKCMEMIGQKEHTSTPFESSYYYTLCAIQFHAGEIDLDTYLKRLEAMMAPKEKYSKRENYQRVFFNTACYIEYLSLYSNKSSAEISSLVEEKVNDVIRYAKLLQIDDVTGYIDPYLENFLEASFDALPFQHTKEIFSQITISRHKATYIHTQVVMRICNALVRYILEHTPQYLEGICDGYSVDYISHHNEEIVSVMNDMALMHDLGKCACTKIISNANRKLEDCEFEIIKRHPNMGYEIVCHSNISKPIVDAMKYHHVWHNGMGGYPQGEPLTNNQPLIDILTIADCLDAATDVFGRSYANSKKIEEVIEEFERDRDTRYAGFVIDALKQPQVLHEVINIIEKERKIIICEAYRQKTFSTKELVKTK